MKNNIASKKHRHPHNDDNLGLFCYLVFSFAKIHNTNASVPNAILSLQQTLPIKIDGIEVTQLIVFLC